MLLKQHAEQKKLDRDLLACYNQQLLSLGRFIFEARQQLIACFSPIFHRYYQQIANAQESTQLRYESQMALPNFEQAFFDSLPKDLILQRTSMGIHRDDFIWELDHHSLKKVGSQGQQKSFVIALKLAQCHYIQEMLNYTPLLLLDDIFDKLDNQRIQHLMQCITQPPFGQVFITDAREMHTQAILKDIDVKKVVLKLTV